MNAGKQPILVLKQDFSCTVTQVTNQLIAAGFSVVRSFDLRLALENYSGCICQMVILLVYAQEGPPATLILDSNNINTLVYLENDPEFGARTRVIELLSIIFAFDSPSEGFDSKTLANQYKSPMSLYDK
jgi:hypothetical protein